ncbi:hypothetical protein CGLAMM_02655 [Acetobacteraceae bacterium EV16G]|uniref:Helix-turn-helix domain-containing protein n=1 Tax=Sorlinia euscelidii TaxID=3081148 RepID=A0ABU7U3V7_9PROT
MTKHLFTWVQKLDLPRIEKLVLVILITLNKSSKKGHIPTVREIASGSSISERSAQRALKNLVNNKIIFATPKSGSATRYEINAPSKKGDARQ